MDTKPFWLSSTFWLNLVSGLVLGASWVLDHQGILPLIGISPALAGVIVTVANIILRFRTSGGQPITMTDRRI